MQKNCPASKFNNQSKKKLELENAALRVAFRNKRHNQVACLYRVF